MPRFLVKLAENKIVEWSTICDAPITRPMTREELHDYIKEEYGNEGLQRLPERLKDMDEFGTSAGSSVEDEIICNRAGKDETELSLRQLLEWADKDFEGEPPVGEVMRDDEDEE